MPGATVSREISVHTLELVPNTTDQIFVVTSSAQAYIMTTQGQLVRRFSSGKQTGAGGDFTCATMSPQGETTNLMGIVIFNCLGFFSLKLIFCFSPSFQVNGPIVSARMGLCTSLMRGVVNWRQFYR